MISPIEMGAVDKEMDESDIFQPSQIPLQFPRVPKYCDQISSVLNSINPLLNDDMLYSRMEQRADLGTFGMEVGSTSAHIGDYILDPTSNNIGRSLVLGKIVDREDEIPLDDDHSVTSDPNDERSMTDKEYDQLWDDLLQSVSVGTVDADEVFAINASTFRGVSSDQLSKVWRISIEEAEDTLKVTSQQKVHGDDPQLAKNYGTNDRLLRYKHIAEYFFMDTFMATQKGGKSSRGNTCCQLFVSDKGYLFSVPMRAGKEVFSAVKRFAKEVGAPDSLICDPIAEHKSMKLKSYLNEIGTSLRLLEEGTP